MGDADALLSHHSPLNGLGSSQQVPSTRALTPTAAGGLSSSAGLTGQNTLLLPTWVWLREQASRLLGKASRLCSHYTAHTADAVTEAGGGAETGARGGGRQKLEASKWNSH